MSDTDEEKLSSCAVQVEREPETEKIALGNRIREARESRKISRSTAATALNVSVSTFKAWENGEREPSALQLKNFSLIYEISLPWLFTGKYNMHEPTHDFDRISFSKSMTLRDTLGNPVNVDDFIFVPRFDIRITAGHGGVWPGHEAIKDILAFRRDWIQSAMPGVIPENLVAANIDGYSQDPTLKHNDLILIDLGDKSSSEFFYVINLSDQGMMVKRLQRLPGGGLNILSDNSHAFPALPLTAEQAAQDLTISGRVRWFARMI